MMGTVKLKPRSCQVCSQIATGGVVISAHGDGQCLILCKACARYVAKLLLEYANQEEDGGKAREIDTLSAAYLKLATATQDTETSKVRLLLIAAIDKMLKGDF